ncbi:hypothetical protein C0J52_21589 [Blattella germanica]|nr:hypothetical protein C0J52_21589 [Blattella germanica]
MGSWIIHHYSPLAHRTHAATDCLVKEGIKLLRHPPYNPDLVPCDFRIFPFINIQLKEQKFETREQLIAGFEKVCIEVPQRN